ncbi:MAG: GNAT family N-acetyltransferase [Planctomycetota bacterium]
MSHVRLITDMRELERLAGEWQALSGSNLLRSWTFQRCWLEHFSTADAVRTLVAEENGKVIGIFPLVEERRLWTGRTLVNVGSGKACLDDLGIMANPDRAVDVARDFASYLLHSRELPWEYLDLDGIRISDPAMQAFAEVFSINSPGSVERRKSPSCWVLPLQPDEDGFHRWPRRLRGRIREARSERQSGDLEVHIARTVHEACSELEVMKSIHQARWQDRGIHGCFSSEAFSGFVRDVVSQTCEAGHSFIAILRWRGTPAAGGIFFIDDTTLSIYLASMAPNTTVQNPGWKLNGLMADYALERGCRQVDFMRGDEEYKGRMGAVPFPQERWMVSSPRFLGRVHRTLYRTAREIKHFIKVPPAPTVPPSVSQPAPIP